MSRVAASTGGRRAQLRASYIWRDEVMQDTVLIEPAPVSLGSSGASTFTVPSLGLPADFAILRPSARGYVLTVGVGMGGNLSLGGRQLSTADFLTGGAGERADGAAGNFRATPVEPGDWGVIELDETGDHTLFFQFVEEDMPLPLSHWSNTELLLPAIAFAIIVHAVFLAMSYQLKDSDRGFLFPGRAELMTAYLVQRPEPPPEPEKGNEPAAAKDGDKEKVKSATQGKSGKAGGEGDKPRARTPDPVDTIDPKLEVGLLDETNRNTMKRVVEQNIDGALKQFINLQGPQTAGGIGSGPGKGTGFGPGEGTGTTRGGKGNGPGGGGSVQGDFQSQGDIDTGETRKPKGSGGTGAGVKETAVVGTGDASGDFGGLSKAEIDRVVKSRSGLIRACYQRELNRTRGLGGKLVVNFSIAADGTVKSARVVGDKSSLRNAAVESCVNRQILKLKFPAKGGGIVNYPFIFSQG